MSYPGNVLNPLGTGLGISADALAAGQRGSAITRSNPIGVAALDLSGSGIGVKDPEPYYEAGDYFVCYSRVPGVGNAGTNAWKVGLAAGSSFQSLHDLGVLIDTTTDPHTTGNGTPSGAGGSIIKDTGGTYHLYFSAVNDWSNVTIGSTFHYTASAPAGPYTFHDIALTDAAGAHKVDNSPPIFFNGQWNMLYIEYSTFPSRGVKLATASSLNGPWTASITVPQAGGGTITDAPNLFEIGGRLFALGAPGDYSVYLFDFSDTTSLIFDGLSMLAYGTNEINADIRASCFVMPDGHTEAVYMALNSSNYYTIHSGLFGAPRIFGASPHVGSFIVYNGCSGAAFSQTTANLYQPTGPNSSDPLPPCCYAASMMCRVTEMGTYTLGEGIRVDPIRFSGEAYPPATNVPAAMSPWVPILGGAPSLEFVGVGTLTNLQIAFTFTQCAWLPL